MSAEEFIVRLRKEKVILRSRVRLPLGLSEDFEKVLSYGELNDLLDAGAYLVKGIVPMKDVDKTVLEVNLTLRPLYEKPIIPGDGTTEKKSIPVGVSDQGGELLGTVYSLYKKGCYEVWEYPGTYRLQRVEATPGHYYTMSRLTYEEVLERVREYKPTTLEKLWEVSGKVSRQTAWVFHMIARVKGHMIGERRHDRRIHIQVVPDEELPPTERRVMR